MENNMTGEDSKESIRENDVIYINTKELEQRNVLPESEITNNEIQVASNDNIISTDEHFSAKNEDIQVVAPIEKHSDTVHITKSSPLKDHFESLKVVVEKIISENSNEDEQISNVIETQTVELDRPIEDIVMESNGSEGAEVELNDEEVKESPSPSQSEDSRATRWEALADIAAELPPSLAVDPLTGQIYSLAK